MPSIQGGRHPQGQKPASRVMVLPRGAWPTGLKSNTLLNGPYLFTRTWNPAAWSSRVACSTDMPIGYGTATVLVCGQVVPAGGLVPITVPMGEFEPTFSMVATRWTRCRAACAAACVSPFTEGTTEVKGPLETRIVIVEPFDTRPAGLVPATM